MKRVDMSLVELVHSGETWPHSQPPCSRQMIRFLERNESVITWVQVPLSDQPWQRALRLIAPRACEQPKCGSVEDQFPVIRVGDEYFTLSLRMMKAVWCAPARPLCKVWLTARLARRRNIRLRKGFVNLEKAAFGGMKLRIPMLLFVEKMRTQSRFNVRPASRAAFPVLDVSACFTHIKTGASALQLMRSMGTSLPETTSPDNQAGGVERRSVHNASSKVSLVVRRMLFPLLDLPMRSHVLLDAESDQVELDLLDQVGRQKPALMEDQQCLFQHLQSLLERYRRGREGPVYSRVAQS